LFNLTKTLGILLHREYWLLAVVAEPYHIDAEPHPALASGRLNDEVPAPTHFLWLLLCKDVIFLRSDASPPQAGEMMRLRLRNTAYSMCLIWQE
jgi:hypothetical protein